MEKNVMRQRGGERELRERGRDWERERERENKYLAKGMKLIKWNKKDRIWTHFHWHWITLPFIMCICLVKLQGSLCPYLWTPWEFWSLKLQRGQRRITKLSLLDALPSIFLMWNIWNQILKNNFPLSIYSELCFSGDS